MICMIINAAGSIYLPYICGNIIDNIANKNNLLPAMLRFIALTVILFVSGSVRGYSFNIIG